MDRFDVLAGMAFLAIIAGLAWVHPGWLIVGGGWLTVNYATRRSR